jgi:hypothetical protein
MSRTSRADSVCCAHMDMLTEAPNLLRRYREGKAFRHYVEERIPLVLPAVVVFFVFSLATAAGTIVFIGGTHPLRTLLAMVLAPFIVLGSLAVLLFVFFSWLEARAMARVAGQPMPSLRSAAAIRAALRRLPIPWVFAAVFVAVPLVVVAALSPKTAGVLIVAAVLTPVLYSLLDR